MNCVPDCINKSENENNNCKLFTVAVGIICAFTCQSHPSCLEKHGNKWWDEEKHDNWRHSGLWQSGRRPLHVFSNTGVGIGALCVWTLIWALSCPHSSTWLPGVLVEWHQLPVEASPNPCGRAGMSQHGDRPGCIFIAPSFPCPSYPLIFIQYISKFEAGKHFFFPACVSVLLINSASLVRGFINIYEVLRLYLKKGQKSCYVVFADLPPKSDVTDGIIGNREGLYINI